MAGTLLSGEAIFPYSRWLAEMPLLQSRYRFAKPYPHIILDNFLTAEIAEKASLEFPPIRSEEWIHYVHLNERKFGKTDLKNFSPTLRGIVEELNSPRFVRFLSDLSGIEGLFADDSLEGGGMHQSPRGGFLNIHADFSVHPHHQDWRRRMNVLIYLNKDWQDSYGGHLELWDKRMKNCAEKVPPVLNRCVIFNTRENAYHGHPEPMTCPEGVTRKSIALYYFSKKKHEPRFRSTEYKARPGDGIKTVGIYLDKMLLRTYDAVKRRLHLSDDFASNSLQAIDRLKRFFSGKKNS